MTDQTIPAEIVGAETESLDYQHRGELRRDYVTRITVVINTPDLARVDLTRPITIHQESLPRTERPGDREPAPAPALPEGWRLADHYRIGRVIVTNPTPNQGGHVYFVTSDDSVPRGSGWGFCTPGELTYLDTEQEEDQ